MSTNVISSLTYWGRLNDYSVTREVEVQSQTWVKSMCIGAYK